MKNRKLRNFLIFVIVIVLVLVGGRLIINAYSKSLARKAAGTVENNKNNPHPLVDNTTVLAYEEELKKQPSDIKGMTKYDKYKKGLSVNDGSDTDKDGLSDKEEIETYKSNPHRKSTAGDLYTDGYKVQNGMDVHTKYDRDPAEITYPNNASRDITLKAETIDDADGRIINVTGVYEALAVPAENYFKWATEHTIYRDYEVKGFGGEISVDVSTVLAENEGLEAKHLKVMISTDPGYQTLKETSVKVDGNKLIPDVKIVNNSGSYLMVIARKALTGNIVADIKNSKAIKLMAGSLSNTTNSLEAKGDALLSNRFGILGSLRIVHPVIYYVPYSDEEKTNAMLDGMVNMGNQCTDAENFVTRADCRQVTREELAAKRELYKKVFPSAEVYYDEGYEVRTSDATFLQMVIFSYINYDESLSGFYDEEVVDNPNADSETVSQSEEGFLNTATFPFTNFGSEASPGGNCEGFSLFTMMLYNKGEVPTEGSYRFGEYFSDYTNVEELSWNIAQDEDNKTLLDRGLSDYKDETWTQLHSTVGVELDYELLSESEKQFVNMIGCYWGLGNEPEHSMYGYNFKDAYVSTETIYNITSLLDEGKVVEWAATLYDGGQFEADGETLNTSLGNHAMLLYDYEMRREECTSIDGGDPFICNVFYFKVYDCNYPRNDTTNILTMIEAPGSDYATFLYNPDPENNGYIARNYKITDELQSTGCFQISDEDFNGYTVFRAFQR